jgi:hypothetical protein
MDINAPTENQVLSFTDYKAAKDAEGRLTPEPFEAAGVSVTDAAPPAPDHDLERTNSKSEILRQGVEAMLRLSDKGSRDWADWRRVLVALGVGRQTAMLEAETNEPRGRGYCTAFAKWLRCHEAFEVIYPADRKHMFDCLDNLSAIEEWRAGLPPAQLLKWNYPPIVLREWKKSRQPASPRQTQRSDGDGGDGDRRLPTKPVLLTPMELRRQLEMLGLDRFRREAMPKDWGNRLRDTALTLATPEQLIDMLQRKLVPRRNAALCFKILRKSLCPTA